MKFTFDTKIITRNHPTSIRLEDRLWESTTLNFRGCWIWNGASVIRYGIITINNKNYRLSRLSLHLYKDFDLDSKLFALHSCDNPRCWNPDHLRAGDTFDNKQDSIDRKRSGNFGITHCPQGHEYTKKNTMIYDRKRVCKICKNIRNQNYRNKIKESISRIEFRP